METAKDNEQELQDFTEMSCWIQDAKRALANVKALLAEGKYVEAREVIARAELGHV